MIILANYIICSIVAVAIGPNRKMILRDWDWLETNLMQTLGSIKLILHYYMSF